MLTHLFVEREHAQPVVLTQRLPHAFDPREHRALQHSPAAHVDNEGHVERQDLVIHVNDPLPHAVIGQLELGRREAADHPAAIGDRDVDRDALDTRFERLRAGHLRGRHQRNRSRDEPRMSLEDGPSLALARRSSRVAGRGSLPATYKWRPTERRPPSIAAGTVAANTRKWYSGGFEGPLGRTALNAM